jgi:anti-anti-sigma regulatory factor
VTPLGGGGGIRLVGEVDSSTIGRLEQALEEMMSTPQGDEITLEMDELSFINVAGARAVVRAAERWVDGRLVVSHPPRVLTLLASAFFPDTRARIEVIPR